MTILSSVSSEVKENVEIFAIYLKELERKFPDLSANNLLAIASELANTHQVCKNLNDIRLAIVER